MYRAIHKMLCGKLFPRTVFTASVLIAAVRMAASPAESRTAPAVAVHWAADDDALLEDYPGDESLDVLDFEQIGDTDGEGLNLFGLQAPLDCDCGRLWFHGMYGDNTQTFDGAAGSVDLQTSYAFPPNFAAFIAGNNPQDTDDSGWQVNSWSPFVFNRYCQFDPASVRCAQFRFDVFYEANDFWSNDSLTFWSDTANQVSGGYGGTGFATDLIGKFGNAPAAPNGFWVAITIDLVHGPVYARRIDGFGNGDANSEECADQIGFVSKANRDLILLAASDGDLQGLIQDDMQLGFAMLSGFAKSPFMAHCPLHVDLREGQVISGDHNALCTSDDVRYVVNSFTASYAQRTVRWWADFNIGAGAPVCEFAVDIEGHRTHKGGHAQIRFWNWSAGQFERLDSGKGVPMGEVNDLPGRVGGCDIQRFVDASGNVRVEVYTQRNYPQDFELRIDMLRLLVRQ